MLKLFSITIFLVLIANVSPLALDTRIVNGVSTDISEVPYQASLKLQRSDVTLYSHACGGVVVSETSVLTAGHCVEEYNRASQWNIVVGTSNRLVGGVTYDVSEIKIHPNYSPLINDIAIMKINGVFPLSNNIQPIGIAPSNYIIEDGTSAVVSGFGNLFYGGAASVILKKAEVHIVNQETCALNYRLTNMQVSNGMICAQFVSEDGDEVRDACTGDSGGPLVSDGLLIGIVSWGYKCAEIDKPGVYTRVSAYSNWINSELGR